MARAGSVALACSALVLTSVLAGCGSSDDPPKLHIGPSSSTPSHSPTKQTSGGLPTTVGRLGLSFSYPDRLSPRHRSAVRTYVDFQRGRVKVTRTGRMNRLVNQNATGPALQNVQQTATYLRKHHGRYAGPTELSVRKVTARGHNLQLRVCDDSTGLKLTLNGKNSPLKGSLRGIDVVTLIGVAGTWKVTNIDTTDETC